MKEILVFCAIAITGWTGISIYEEREKNYRSTLIARGMVLTWLNNDMKNGVDPMVALKKTRPLYNAAMSNCPLFLDCGDATFKDYIKKLGDSL